MPLLPRAVAAFFVLAVNAVVVLSPAAATATPRAGSPAAERDLAHQVRVAVRRSTAGHVDYRIHVAGVGTISHDATTQTAPASNEKLFTTVTLLQLVGPDFHYDTAVDGTAPISATGELDGDLMIVGAGDPTLTSADLHGLAKQLHRAGLRHVTGDLVVDDSRYGHATIEPGWKHKFVPIETGPVDAFTVNRNTWRGGASFDKDPSQANAGLWRAALRNVGITTHGSTQVGAAPALPAGTTLVPLANHRSGPLSQIVAHTLSTSDNFYAEMMLREAGAQGTGHGSAASGIAAVRAEGESLGVTLGTIHDGSGLSYTDRESPSIIVRWLTAVQGLPIYQDFVASLATSCKPGGTLQYRLCGNHLTGVVHAKTGTLNHITALSGWTTTRSGQLVTFSFLVSAARSVSTAASRVDAAIRALVRS